MSAHAPGTAESAGTATLSEEWHRALRWAERQLGGRITRVERQPRWRPAAFLDLDLERDGQTLPIYFRGQRGKTDMIRLADFGSRPIARRCAVGGTPPNAFSTCNRPAYSDSE